MPNPKVARPSDVVYLACPYTHADPRVREERFHFATRAAAHLIEQGHIVYSPITMTHPIDIVLADEGQTLGSEYWVAFDEAFMRLCGSIMVLKIDGWLESNGVNREIKYFEDRGIPVIYIEPIDVL